jgi:hypothetical protein
MGAPFSNRNRLAPLRTIWHGARVQHAGKIVRSGGTGGRLELAALSLVGSLYFLVFATTRDQPISDTVEATARNLFSLALAVALARPLIARLLAWPKWQQAAGHVGLAAAFSLFWLWTLTVLGALLGAESALRFTVAPFLFGPAAAWQLLQGLFAYGLLAALLALQARPAAMTGLIIMDDLSKTAPDRFLVRSDEEIVPLAASRIVSIAGADDYAEVTTVDGTHLVQTRLAEFEGRLDPAHFLRVHRSAIVNLDRLVRAEPSGGGRMLLIMEAGPDVSASRTGAKALRERLL